MVFDFLKKKLFSTEEQKDIPKEKLKEKIEADKKTETEDKLIEKTSEEPKELTRKEEQQPPGIESDEALAEPQKEEHKDATIDGSKDHPDQRVRAELQSRTTIEQENRIIPEEVKQEPIQDDLLKDVPEDKPLKTEPKQSKTEVGAEPPKDVVQETIEKELKKQPLETDIISPSIEKEDTFFSRLKTGLSKTRDFLNTDINELFTASKTIDDELFDELEELLVTSDLGIDITMDLMEKLRSKSKKLSTANELRQVLKEEILALFPKEEKPVEELYQKPHVIMVVGVNGTGKTTTLGKLAMKFNSQGKKVLIAAADTFRAAAIEQVQIWADRSDAMIVKHKEGADPAAVAYDAVEASIARGIDIVLVDTAGRLHTQKNLMEELKKIKRSINKKMSGAPHEVLMVLDATTGQNAISQAKLFNEAVDITQVALTKLDGTAKGGIVAAIANTMDLPIRYIGVGEQINDLQEFEAKRFVDALFD